MSKPFIHLAVAACFLMLITSCSSYEYLRLDSGSMTRNDHKDLIWENDTVKLAYNFHGKNGPMKLSIFNKTDKPLYIDWKRSALVRDQQSISLYDSRVNVSGSADAFTFPVGRRWSYTTTSFSGTLNLPEGVDMIAPHAFISKELFTTYNDKMLLDSVAVGSLPEQTQPRDGYSYPVRYKTITFNQETSPF